MVLEALLRTSDPATAQVVSEPHPRSKNGCASALPGIRVEGDALSHPGAAPFSPRAVLGRLDCCLRNRIRGRCLRGQNVLAHRIRAGHLRRPSVRGWLHRPARAAVRGGGRGRRSLVRPSPDLSRAPCGGCRNAAVLEQAQWPWSSDALERADRALQPAALDRAVEPRLAGALGSPLPAAALHRCALHL